VGTPFRCVSDFFQSWRDAKWGGHGVPPLQLSATDKMNYLDSVILVEDRVVPVHPSNYVVIEFNGDLFGF
jgi:hypothetical protein